MKSFSKDNSSIYYLEGDVNYTIAHYLDGSKEMSSYTLKRHLETLSKQKFIRINKGLVVNTQFVKKVISQGGTKKALMHNGLGLSISRRRSRVLDRI